MRYNNPLLQIFGPYDEAFLVRKQLWGTHVSYSLTDDRALIISLTLESCVAATRSYLKSLQDGAESGSRPVH